MIDIIGRVFYVIDVMHYFNDTKVSYWQTIRQYTLTLLFIFIFGPFALIPVNTSTSILIDVMTLIFYIPALIIITLNLWEKDEYVSTTWIILPIILLLDIVIGLSKETKDMFITFVIILLYLKPAFTARLRV